MTRKEQDRLWYKYDAFRNRKVRQYVPKVYKALQEQYRYFARTKDIQNLPLEPVIDVVTDIYRDVGKIWGVETYRQVLKQAGLKKGYNPPILMVKAGAPIGFNAEFINAILAYFRINLLNQAVLPITETSRKFIEQVLSEQIEQGFSLDEAVKRIMTDGHTRTRSELIARTEVMKAANVGEQIGVDKTGLQTNKVWLSVRDNRTRRDHLLADNQTVPDGKPFIIGVEQWQMMRPGDGTSQDGRKVSADEICNCRCVVARDVVLDEDGLPLRKL